MPKMSRPLSKGFKSNKSRDIYLEEHTNDVLNVFGELLSKLPQGIKSNLVELKTQIELAIFCHDFGKVLPAFQIKTLKNRDYQPFYPYDNIPHSLFSLFFINKEELKRHVEPNGYVDAILSSIAFHHWRDGYDDILNYSKNEIKSLCKKMLEDDSFCEELENRLKGEFKNSKFKQVIKFNTDMVRSLLSGLTFKDFVVPPYGNNYLPLRNIMNEDHKRKWIFIAGFLIRCDHFASFCEAEGQKFNKVEIPSISDKDVKLNVKTKINQKDEAKIWQIQTLKTKADANLILIAPTGSGKTEFALLWSNGEKLIYTLPLRSAVNQIFERAEKIFNSVEQQKVGLLHSDADIYLLNSGGENEEARIYDFSRQMSLPVLISTGDQFFPYALRFPAYEKIYSILAYSRLVIDEVQAYDPRACALIVKFIQDIQAMGGKFLLMTATLPQFVKDEILRRCGEIDLTNIYEVKKEQHTNLRKHKLKIIHVNNKLKENNKPDFTLPDGVLNSIVGQADTGKRVLVILNTINAARKVYEDLSKLYNTNKLWLIHSGFTLNDRQEKERLLEEEFKNPKCREETEGKILVATQVVEASLDIDADVLFTEISPLDALVQRMGRILRRVKLDEDDKIAEYGTIGQNKIAKKILNDGKSFAVNDENIFVIVFRNGIESGNGWVYDRDLLVLSLKILANTINAVGLTEWAKKTLKEKKQGEKILTEILKSITEKHISEYEKFEVVEMLYKALPDGHKYLKDFYETLDILDAGYMSDKKQDALRIFREIYTLPAITKSMVGNFKQKLTEYLQRDTLSYTSFKAEILSKFIVNVDARKYIKQDASHLVYEIGFENKEKVERVQKWLKDIYLCDGEYDSRTGFKPISVGSDDGFF